MKNKEMTIDELMEQAILAVEKSIPAGTVITDENMEQLIQDGLDKFHGIK